MIFYFVKNIYFLIIGYKLLYNRDGQISWLANQSVIILLGLLLCHYVYNNRMTIVIQQNEHVHCSILYNKRYMYTACTILYNKTNIYTVQYYITKQICTLYNIIQQNEHVHCKIFRNLLHLLSNSLFIFI